MAAGELWTQEENKKLKDKYYITDLDDLVIEFGRSRGSLISRMCIINKTRSKKKNKQIDKCPNCGEIMNRVEGGYFCKYCLKEYNLYGEFLSPLGGEARRSSK